VEEQNNDGAAAASSAGRVTVRGRGHWAGRRGTPSVTPLSFLPIFCPSAPKQPTEVCTCWQEAVGQSCLPRRCIASN